MLTSSLAKSGFLSLTLPITRFSDNFLFLLFSNLLRDLRILSIGESVEDGGRPSAEDLLDVGLDDSEEVDMSVEKDISLRYREKTD